MIRFFWSDIGETVDKAREYCGPFTKPSHVAAIVARADYESDASMWDDGERELVLVTGDGVRHRFTVEAEVEVSFNAYEEGRS